MPPHPRPRPILKPSLDPSLFSAFSGYPACYPSPRSALPFSGHRPPSRCGTPISFGGPGAVGSGITPRTPSPHVHFPPTPTLASTVGTTHPASVYDREPIAVLPNTCALPARGERVYHYRESSRSLASPPLPAQMSTMTARPFPCSPRRSRPRPRLQVQVHFQSQSQVQTAPTDAEGPSQSPVISNLCYQHQHQCHHPRPILHAAITASAWRRVGSFNREGTCAGVPSSMAFQAVIPPTAAATAASGLVNGGEDASPVKVTSPRATSIRKGGVEDEETNVDDNNDGPTSACTWEIRNMRASPLRRSHTVSGVGLRLGLKFGRGAAAPLAAADEDPDLSLDGCLGGF